MGLNLLQFPHSGDEMRLGLDDISSADNYGPQQAVDSLRRNLLRSLANQSALDGEWLRSAEAQNYKLALIPPQNLMNQSGPDAPAPAGMNSVFVLPLTWNDLVTHLRAEARHPQSNLTRDVYSFGAIQVKFSSMEVYRSGQLVQLTYLEFKILRYLISRAMQVVSRDELLSRVWGFDNYPCTRTVDTLVCRLRRKLEPDRANPKHFHSVHAVGYKFTP
jgi:DNA-binding winged helix-turn-helix (wHTH) protein